MGLSVIEVSLKTGRGPLERAKGIRPIAGT
jgi:hypothetical protein